MRHEQADRKGKVISPGFRLFTIVGSNVLAQPVGFGYTNTPTNDQQMETMRSCGLTPFVSVSRKMSVEFISRPGGRPI
jgi:hypothetical protein